MRCGRWSAAWRATVDIDRGMALGCGHPMGPLTLLDFVGLDTVVRIGEIMFAEYREERYAPPPLLKRMVAAGSLGRKSGKGFYDYARDTAGRGGICHEQRGGTAARRHAICAGLLVAPVRVQSQHDAATGRSLPRGCLDRGAGEVPGGDGAPDQRR